MTVIRSELREQSSLRADLESIDVARGFLIGAAVSLPMWIGIAGLIFFAHWSLS